MTIKEFKIQLALGTAPHNVKLKFAQDYDTPKAILDRLAKDKNRHISICAMFSKLGPMEWTRTNELWPKYYWEQVERK